VSTEVCTTSGRNPASRSSRPPAVASPAPFSESPTSTQPVNRPSEFHVLSPCLSSTSVDMPPSLSAAVYRPAERVCEPRRSPPFMIPGTSQSLCLKDPRDHGGDRSRLAAGILGVVVGCLVSPGLLFLFFDEPFDGGQGVGVQAGWGQLRLQLPGLS